MRVLFFSPSNTSGGAERVMSLLANELSKEHEVFFVTLDSNTKFYELRADVKKISLNLYTVEESKIIRAIRIIPLEIKRYCKFKEVCKKIKPDVVVSFLFMTNVIGTLVCRKSNIPIIISERNDPMKYGKIKRIVMKCIYSKASVIVCQSDYMKDYAIKQYHLGSTYTIPNPLVSDQYVEKVIEAKKKQVISVGRLIPQKNQKLLIKAFTNLADKYPEYEMHIYGEGPLKNELQNYINTLKMEKRIFLAGVEKEVLKKHADAQLFVLSSNFEGYPNVLVEAMANGIISISTDFPTRSARDIIKENENGFLIPVGDEKALTNRIDLILSEPSKYSYIAKNGRRIAQEIDISIIATKWEKIMEKAIREKRGIVKA